MKRRARILQLLLEEGDGLFALREHLLDPCALFYCRVQLLLQRRSEFLAIGVLLVGSRQQFFDLAQASFELVDSFLGGAKLACKPQVVGHVAAHLLREHIADLVDLGGAGGCLLGSCCSLRLVTILQCRLCLIQLPLEFRNGGFLLLDGQEQGLVRPVLRGFRCQRLGTACGVLAREFELLQGLLVGSLQVSELAGQRADLIT